MNAKEITRRSRKLSLVLRHQPDAIGLELDRHGWADVTHLLKRLAATGTPTTRQELETVVAENDKQRFSFSADGRRIRANQGHSIDVDLQLTAVDPPERLFHGTATRFLEAILAEGLSARSRQHVHLSADPDTAVTVGSRHGRPVVLGVNAAAMVERNHVFYRSANGVWLTDAVPAEYLEVLEYGR